jgi:hypothetical protein
MDVIIKGALILGSGVLGFLVGWTIGATIANIRDYDDRFDIWYEDEW